MDGLSESRLSEIRAEFDLSDLNKFPIFAYFQLHSSPYVQDDPTAFLRISFEDHVKIAESFIDGLGSKLGHDPSSDTWFLEQWTSSNTTKCWKDSFHQWGESITKALHSETGEKWSFLPDEVSYEHFHLEAGNSYGSKSGKKASVSWKEIWHKKPEDLSLEKYWVSASGNWGEKEGVSNGKRWELQWKEEGNFFEEKSMNEENGKKWGHVKGRDSGKSWNENWEDAGDEKSNDKWWQENGKRWGVKNIRKGITEYCEEWEEASGYHRISKNFDDGKGRRTRYTEGKGDGFSYIEDYSFEEASDEHKTIKTGFSPEGKWESFILKQGDKTVAKHKGEDANGSWEEEWEEEGDCKKAKKKGKSGLGGEWEEEWEETADRKYCKKWGIKGEEWSEQWAEEAGRKYCKKEQRRDGNFFLQEWEEFIEGNEKRSIGKFYENSVVVKEWNALVPLSVD